MYRYFISLVKFISKYFVLLIIFLISSSSLLLVYRNTTDFYMLVLNVRPETIKLLEENIGNMVFESVVVILFFRSVFLDLFLLKK